MEFKLWIESSLSDLYSSAVKAFPTTKARQHLVPTVEVSNIRWLPYLGVRTLLCRALAETASGQYHPLLLFRNVGFTNNKAGMQILAEDGKTYYVGQIFNDTSDVNVRCDCEDFKWRFKYYNYQDHSLYGHPGSEYIGSKFKVNPSELPGMCKHLMALMQSLNDKGYLA